MSGAVRLGSFALALVAVFAAAAAVGSAVGPLERGRDAPAHAGRPALDPEPVGLAVAARGFRLAPLQTRLLAGRRQAFAFRILDGRGQPLRAYDTTHTRRMHAIVVRRDLTAFRHLHPSLGSDGTWTVSVPALRPGAYRAFADFATGGQRHVLGIDLFVSGRAPLRRVPPPTRGTLAGPYRVYLNSPAPAAGERATLRFGVRLELARVVLDRYLGARGHLVVLREGDLAYLHVHADRDELAFATTFPTPGRYRAFLEFSAGGRVYTAPFTLDVAR